MKRSRQYNFTLFEMLISIALLVVLSVVLLRTFALVSDFWRTTNDQSTFYLDASIAMSNISEELANVIYHSEVPDEKSLKAPIYVGEPAVTPECFSSTSNSVTKGRMLCFITRSRKGGSNTEYSDICKVAYIFYPPTKAANGNHSGITVDDEPSGVLVRAFVNENSYVLDSLKGTANMNSVFNFNSAALNQVINNVIDFDVTGYKLRNASDPSQGVDKITFNNSDGGKDLAAIHISMRLIAPNMLEEYRNEYVLAAGNESDRLAFLKKHSKVFSKLIWISPMKDK